VTPTTEMCTMNMCWQDTADDRICECRERATTVVIVNMSSLKWSCCWVCKGQGFSI